MRFNELMKEKGFTVASLAAKSGINPRTLEQYSSGRYPLRNARGYVMVAIAEALEIHPKDLIDLDEPSV